MTMNKLKIKKEVWSNNSDEFGGYDYASPDDFAYNIDRIENGIVYLWSINGHGRTIYAQVNIYEFEMTWRETIK